jgi:hypothetical protein
MDELFMRSHTFRARLLDDFRLIVDLSCGLEMGKKLPKPAHAAELLRRLALLAIQRWNDKFGTVYKKVCGRGGSCLVSRESLEI